MTLSNASPATKPSAGVDDTASCFGLRRTMTWAILTQSCCASVTRMSPPLSPRIFSKESQTTPTKRFRNRKLPTSMKMRNTAYQPGFSSRRGMFARPVESTAAYMTSIQPSVVAISKRLSVATKTLSKDWDTTGVQR